MSETKEKRKYTKRKPRKEESCIIRIQKNLKEEVRRITKEDNSNMSATIVELLNLYVLAKKAGKKINIE